MESGRANYVEQDDLKPSIHNGFASQPAKKLNVKPQPRSRRKQDDLGDDASKRRCISTACTACRKRKSKCDGNLPKCAACSQVYGTECIYDPSSDHRRKGTYRTDSDDPRTRNSTLQTLIQALLNYQEDEAFDLLREMRKCESLDTVAEDILSKDHGFDLEDSMQSNLPLDRDRDSQSPSFETQLYGKMGDLRLEEGSVRYIGGTSNLIHVENEDDGAEVDEYPQQENAVTSWTRVTDDPNLVVHLLNMYFTWHYTFFTTMSKPLFMRDFLLGRPPSYAKRKTYYCSSLLVNALLALGCHFTSHPGARENPDDSATAGDHFFREAKRLIMENDEHERPRLTTVQALALMSVREAGCGREAKGWVYSGMSFRMACDMGLNLNTGQLTTNKHVNGDEAEEDVRRITFWGCYLFDKCWSNYLGRMPQLPTSILTVSKVEVFPDEESEQWSPYTDSGFSQANSQPSRTRAVALQISKLCEISNDLMKYFYNPADIEKNRGKSAELKLLSELHARLETWRRELPNEFEPREGCLSSVLTMHMFFQLLYIHLFRPFLKYTQTTSPLPQTVSPRKLCTQAAAMISKLMRLYKRSYGLRQICNITVYIMHSACTIHLLNLPDKNAKRDIVHGVKHLEEIAEGWLCARRTLGILSVLARKWKVQLPEEASAVLARTDRKFGRYVGDGLSPSSSQHQSPGSTNPGQFNVPQEWQGQPGRSSNIGYANSAQTQYAAGNVNQPQTGTTMPATSMPSHMRTSSSISPQYPSASASMVPPPQTTISETTLGPQQKVFSPSDTYLGLEGQQPAPNPQDWIYQDQAQYAPGFENWMGTNNLEPALWEGGGGAVNVSGAPPVGSMGTSMPMSTSQAGSNVLYEAEPGMFDWLNGTGMYNSMATYDENSWYQ